MVKKNPAERGRERETEKDSLALKKSINWLEAGRVVENVSLNCGTAIDLCMFSGIRPFERRMRAKIIGCTVKLSHLSTEKVQYK